jgi:hypothetical protein
MIDIFLQQPWMTLAVALGLLSIFLSLATGVLRVWNTRTLQTAVMEMIVKRGGYSMIHPTTPLKIYIGGVKSGEFNRQTFLASIIEIPAIQFINLREESNSLLPHASYLNAVKESDIFILAIDKELTSRTQEEYSAAIELDKPILIFVMNIDSYNNIDYQKLLTKPPLMWVSVSTYEELGRETQRAIFELLINTYHQHRVPKTLLHARFKGE